MAASARTEPAGERSVVRWTGDGLNFDATDSLGRSLRMAVRDLSPCGTGLPDP